MSSFMNPIVASPELVADIRAWDRADDDLRPSNEVPDFYQSQSLPNSIDEQASAMLFLRRVRLPRSRDEFVIWSHAFWNAHVCGSLLLVSFLGSLMSPGRITRLSLL